MVGGVLHHYFLTDYVFNTCCTYSRQAPKQIVRHRIAMSMGNGWKLSRRIYGAAQLFNSGSMMLVNGEKWEKQYGNLPDVSYISCQPCSS